MPVILFINKNIGYILTEIEKLVIVNFNCLAKLLSEKEYN